MNSCGWPKILGNAPKNWKQKPHNNDSNPNRTSEKIGPNDPVSRASFSFCSAKSIPLRTISWIFAALFEGRLPRFTLVENRPCREPSLAADRHNSASVEVRLYRGMSGHWRKVPMLARILKNAPEILFLVAGSILVVGVANLF